MPKLPQYTAQLGDAPISGGRRATGEDFGGAVAEAMGGLARQATKVGQQIIDDTEQRDARHAQVEHAKIRQKYAKALEDAEISGGDVDAIRQKMEQEVDGVRGQVGTRTGLQTADLHAANTLNVFDTKSAQVKATRAGIEARTQGAEWINAQGAILATNPSYLPVAEAEAAAFAETFKGRLSPEKIEEVKRTLVQQANVGAVKALTRLAPEETKRRLEAGEFNLTPEMRAQEVGRADSQIRAVREEKEHAVRWDQYQKQVASQEARDEHFKSIMGGTFKPTVTVADGRLTTQDREHLIVFNKTWMDAKLGQEKKSNPTVVRDMLLRIYAPEGSPDKVYADDVLYEPLKNGQLNATDYERLRKAIAEQRDPNNSTVGSLFNGMQRTIGRAISQDPTYIGRPQLVAAIENGWADAVRGKMADWRKEGKNPTELFSPSAGKDYVGAPAFIAQFVRQATQQPGVALPVGTIKSKDGADWRFLGGDLKIPQSWERVRNGQRASGIIGKGG